MDDWLKPLEGLVSNRFMQAALILVLSLLVARIVDGVLTRAVRRLTAKTASDLDDRIVEAMHRPLYVSFILLGAWGATLLLDLPVGLTTLIFRLLQTVTILVWTVAGLAIGSALLQSLSRLAERVTWLESRTLPLFDNLAKLMLVGASIYFLLLVWDLNLGAWLASAGVLALAVGFAAKDSLANLFGGLFVIMDAPYKIGDFINLDSGERGRVTKIGLRSTRLLTRDDVEITVPNAAIANAKIINESGGPWEKMRVTATVGVAYGSDVEAVRGVLMRAARSVEAVSGDPEPRVRFTEMGDSALIFHVLCWVDEPVLRGQCLDALNTAIYNGLRAAKIVIPFPQRDVHLYRDTSA